MRRTAFIFMMLMALLAGQVWGRGVGTSVMNFLKVTHGPRFDGMGGVGVALVDDINSITWNPAGLSHLAPDYFDASFEHDFWIGDIEYEALNFATYLGDTYGGGLQLLYRHMPDIDNDLADEQPQKVWDFAGTLGLGITITNFSVGVNLKAIASQLGDAQLMGIAGDLGMQIRFMEDKFSVGLAVQNLGPDIKTDSLPLFIRGGIGYKDSFGSKKQHELLGAFEINQPLDNKLVIRLGAEYWYAKTVAARVGYVQQIGADDLQSDKFLDRLTWGASVRWADLQIDYAFIPFADLGSVHKLALKLHYGPLTDTVENF